MLKVFIKKKINKNIIKSFELINKKLYFAIEVKLIKITRKKPYKVTIFLKIIINTIKI